MLYWPSHRFYLHRPIDQYNTDAKVHPIPSHDSSLRQYVLDSAAIVIGECQRYNKYYVNFSLN
jgi:hypothetical protein